MNCETIRRVAKLIIGWSVVPFLILFLPILLVLVPPVELFSSDSCEEYKKNCTSLINGYIQLIKELVVGR